MRGTVLAALIAASIGVLSFSGCGSRAITAGSRPFPSEKAVFVDASGKALTDLPSSEEPIRLVVFDFPWCPPCAEIREAVHGALDAVPPGSVRIYRVLFDREILITAGGKSETTPLRPAPPPWPGFREGAGEPVTTLTAVPEAFREEFRLTRGPVLLLLEPDGTVARRWNGYSTELEKELTSELKARASRFLKPPRK